MPSCSGARSRFAARATRCYPLRWWRPRPRFITAFTAVPDLYASPYLPEALRQKAAEVAAAPGVAQAYLYFNNDIGGSAISNAQEMRALASEL